MSDPSLCLKDKLESLSAASIALEAAPIRADEKVVELAARYSLLGHTLRAISEARALAEGRNSSDLEFETLTEPLLDQMHEIAWEAVATPARTVAGLRGKARILADWCEDRRANLSDALAASLCADISRMSTG